MKLQALLFDLDGTLADTDRLHEQAWLEALARYGIKADHHYYQTQISGGLNPEIVRRVLPQLSQAEGDRFLAQKEARFRELATQVAPLPGLLKLWKWAQERGLRRALVSNAPRENAEHILGQLGLCFDLVVLSEELPTGKPDPLPYRTALQRLGLGPEAALAFEDSPSGVRSAVGAGIPTVALTTGHRAYNLEQAGAFLCIPDFTDARLWSWLRSHDPAAP
ncbi:MAG: HAD-IA family hydrolase [Meiothermus sp.]|uniref:HAD family hydrolase n=1 Tax=Meiothermus sp. TaxID=1955249 RepID=UPI0025EF6F34|nr:HAD-IA family hydrolase [Meiothermus sp.]MCS7058463.1 HAD-IA family hydrolase [Meiothermus sp.]MCS7193403.1 HAD-IA family hydrolase [Meiothermus sp.]MCX7739788.1 HAD-IA family hydrolase [Meiothermus sp.]MDW8090916.1 HAD-IA family hydrolase [Meiothermus sp.]MDW8482055.1 HAD-IA family hydrolase [Meiothermus sp.]